MTDQLTPNVLVVNPDGTISAALSGSLLIPADVSSVESGVAPAHAVRWTSGAQQVAEIGAVANPTAVRNTLIATATSPDGKAVGLLDIAASNDDSLVEVYSYLNGAVVDHALILDGNGTSSFPRLLTAQKVVVSPLIVTGTTGILSPGGKVDFTLTHNLGTTNIAVLGSIFQSRANVPSSCGWAWLLDTAVANSVQIEVQNVGSVATFAQWAGVVVGFF